MNKFQASIICAAVSVFISAQAAYAQPCCSSCDCGAKCRCGTDGYFCGEESGQDEPDAGMTAVRRTACINLVRNFVSALQNREYSRAYRMLDGNTGNDLIRNYTLYVPLSKEMPSEQLLDEFTSGGTYAEKYWKWYIKDSSINRIKVSRITEAEPLENEDGFIVKNPVSNAVWIVVKRHGQYHISIPRG